MNKIVIIRGPLGSGKTTISKMLAKKLDAEHISIDDVLEELKLDVVPEGEPGIPVEHFIQTNEHIVPLITKAREEDRPVIIDGNFYHKEAIEDLEKRFSDVVVFTLKLPLEECIKRDEAREKTYGAGAATAVHNMVSAFDYGTVIDASGSREETMEHILNKLNV